MINHLIVRKQLLFLFIFIVGGTFAQQMPDFSTKLYFEDAGGNKDTLAIGYDTNGTTGIDAQFGETNTLSTPWSSNSFEVRITNGWQASFPSANESFRTKKQIVKNHCGQSWSYNPLIYIDLKNAQFPVTMKFDYAEFTQNPCTIGSLISAMESNALYDGGGYVGNMHNYTNGEMIIDTVGTPDIDLNAQPNMRYKDVDNKTIYSIWVQFGGHDLQTLATHKNNNGNVSIFPNPFHSAFKIQTKMALSDIQIVDLQGRNIDFYKVGSTIHLPNCKSGIYILSAQQGGHIYNFKIIKR